MTARLFRALLGRHQHAAPTAARPKLVVRRAPGAAGWSWRVVDPHGNQLHAGTAGSQPEALAVGRAALDETVAGGRR